MSTPILTTKLYLPSIRSGAVARTHLINQLNGGAEQKLTLVSAPAGFGKTTLVGAWLATLPSATAWLSLDARDNDPIRFWAYLISALQTAVSTIDSGLLTALHAPQPPPLESILTSLLNQIATVPELFHLVLDDYHLLDTPAIDKAVTFFLDNLPPNLRLLIITREDPSLPLARYRARGELNELRAADLRFTETETAIFLREVMGLTLAPADIIALEKRTEGWIAGLQLAALSLQGQTDPTAFIKSFTGSHRFILDYLVEEVLQQQPEPVQTFLLHTAILDRLCGSLCEAVLPDPALSGVEMLTSLEQTNLFIVPLDNERHWYRYHHLFAELLRQRLLQKGETAVADLHKRASGWYERHDLPLEAFRHAVLANDAESAARLVEGDGMPLIFRGAVTPVLNWLATLPTALLDQKPALWVIYASALLFVGEFKRAAAKVASAEKALPAAAELTAYSRDLVGHIASVRATLAVLQYDVPEIVAQSQRALAYLHPHNLPVRTATSWTLGVAYQLQGERTAARRAFTEAIGISETIGHTIITLSANIGLGNMQEADIELPLAVETYQRVLQLAGEPPFPVACEAYLGLARIYYEWNELERARQYGETGLQLAHQLGKSDRFIGQELFLARLKLAEADTAGAERILRRVTEFVEAQQLAHQWSALLPVQLRSYLQQGKIETATALVAVHPFPIPQARLYLAQGNISPALAILEKWQAEVEAKGWQAERVEVVVLQAVAYWKQGDGKTAVSLLENALALAEPSGFIRTFLDEGEVMGEMLETAVNQGGASAYSKQLLALFNQGAQPMAQPLIEPLSERELEILHLIADGLSNREISERLFLALSTVKGHNQRVFGKLQVQRRTEAVAEARRLGLL